MIRKTAKTIAASPLMRSSFKFTLLPVKFPLAKFQGSTGPVLPGLVLKDALKKADVLFRNLRVKDGPLNRSQQILLHFLEVDAHDFFRFGGIAVIDSFDQASMLAAI